MLRRAQGRGPPPGAAALAVIALAAGAAGCGAPSPLPPPCRDGVDNDGDGLVDFPDDPGCASPFDRHEEDPGECADGVDNDLDGRTDWPADPACASAMGAAESPDPHRMAACADGLDNDKDGRTDYPKDPGCANAHDDDETDPPTRTACDNGADDDSDGKTDWPADPGCIAASDGDESDPVGTICGPMVPVEDLGLDAVAEGDVTSKGFSALMGACGGLGAERVFRVTLPPGPPADLVASTVDPATTLDSVVYVRRDCRLPASELGCNDDASPGVKASTAVVHGATPGTYFVVVDPFGIASVGKFRLRVETRVPEGGACDPSVKGAQCAPDRVCRAATAGAPRTCEKPVCGDGKDNDGDAKIDFPADPGCDDPLDPDEADPMPARQCANGKDDDGDMKTDWPADPGCASASDDKEAEECVPGLDLGPLDWKGATGEVVFGRASLSAGSCAWTSIGAENAYLFVVDKPYAALVFSTENDDTNFYTSVYVRAPKCGDVGDELGCGWSGFYGTHAMVKMPVPGPYYVFVDGVGDSAYWGSYRLTVRAHLLPGSACDPADGTFVCSEGHLCKGPMDGPYACAMAACNDGMDNDGDGKADYPEEPGCYDKSDDDEDDPTYLPDCGNGRDDDNDGKTDYPDDTGCAAASDWSELDLCGPWDLWEIPPAGIDGWLRKGEGGWARGSCAKPEDAKGVEENVFGLAVKYDLKRLWATTDSLSTKFDTVLYIRNAACGVYDTDKFTEVGCNDDVKAEDPGRNVLSRLEIAPLGRGSYYVFVDGKPPADGPFPGGSFHLDVGGEIEKSKPCPAGSKQFVCEPGYTCKGPTDAETCGLAACKNGVDDDGDGKTDYPNDPGCDDESDDGEIDDHTRFCSDGIDNDGDGLTDYRPGKGDPDCQAASDGSESGDCPQLVPLAYPDPSGKVAGVNDGQSRMQPPCDWGDGAEYAAFVQIPGNMTYLRANTAGSFLNTTLTVQQETCKAGATCGGPSWEGPWSCCNGDAGAKATYSDVFLLDRTAGGYYFIVDGRVSSGLSFRLQISGELKPDAPCNPAQAGYIACPAGQSCKLAGPEWKCQ